MNSETKKMPSDSGIEQMVLGVLLFIPNSFDHILDFITPECFHDSRHRLIFDTFLNQYQKNRFADLSTVTRELLSNDKINAAGGAWYVTELTGMVVGDAMLDYNARLLAEFMIRRQTIMQCNETMSRAYDDSEDIFEVLATSMVNTETMLGKVTKGSPLPLSQLAVTTLQEMEAMAAKKDTLTGVPTGFPMVDQATGGWQKSDLIILAARPGMGKSALAMSFALNASIRNGQTVMFFSLEMSTQQLMFRLYAAEAGIPLSIIIRGKMDTSDFLNAHKASEGIVKGNLFIDDTSGLSVYELKAKARTQKNKSGKLDMIIIDYLQLLSLGTLDKAGNREQEISKISKALKAMAKELDVPVIALSQLSRKVEERANKQPMLSDLRESGSIEQDADLVTFLFRPEYYQDKDEIESGDKGYAEFTIAKHRNGSLDDFPMIFDGSHMRFSEQVDAPGATALFDLSDHKIF